VPSSRRPPAAALAALLALALAGCQRADPDVVPFAVRITDQAGAPVLPNVDPQEFLVAIEGPAVVAGPGALTVTDPVLGPVSVTFDAAAHPGVAFPAQLDGQVVRVHAQHNPAAVAPGGAPLPYPALRVGLIRLGETSFQFLLVDSPYSDDAGLPVVPRPIGPEPLLGDGVDPLNDPDFPDFPIYGLAAAHARFEAACGLVYHDVLVVEGAAAQAGDRVGTVIETSPVPWTTLHVDSWHRTGSCPGRAKTWTQWAAWR
jgi:hypothetical protein